MALIGSSIENKIWNYLKSKGLNDCGVAGLMGNLYAESGLRPDNLQNSYEKMLGFTDATYTAAVDSGAYKNFAKDAAGYGLAQWTYHTRKAALLQLTQQRKCSIADLEMQLDYLYAELSSGYKAVLSILKTARTVKEASDIVLTKFERPKDQSDAAKNKRASYSQAYYDKFSETQTKKTASCVTMISNCGKDENGKYAGGKAGDQTGKEYTLIPWYNRPWACVLRHPDANVRAEIASTARAAAENDMIGYDQSERLTYHKQLQKVNWRPEKITTACESDCSSSTVANVIAAGHRTGNKKLQEVSPSLTTRNMRGELTKAGFTALMDKKYLGSSDYLIAGDILLYDGHHAAINITDGNKATSNTIEDAQKIQNVSNAQKTSAAASYDKNVAGTYKVTARSLNIRSGAGKKFTPLGVLKKDTSVRNYGYYTDTSGERWLYVQAGNITGFCYAAYLQKTV